MLLPFGTLNASKVSFVTLLGNQIPWESQGSTVNAQYFTSSTAFSLPQYPVGMSIAATNPNWDNTTYSPSTSLIGSRFAIKMTANSFPYTSNSCATPAHLNLHVRDKTTGVNSQHWVIGDGGNAPYTGCGFSWNGTPVTETYTSNGVSFQRTTWSKGSGSASIEVTTGNKLIVNGVERLSNVEVVAASIYAGYDGGTMNGTVEYLAKFI